MNFFLEEWCHDDWKTILLAVDGAPLTLVAPFVGANHPRKTLLFPPTGNQPWQTNGFMQCDPETHRALPCEIVHPPPKHPSP